MTAAFPSTDPSGRRAVWSVVFATTMVQALVTLSAVVPSVIAPDLAPDLDVPTAFIGYQIAVVYGAAMMTSVIGGTMVQRLGACRISQVALCLCVTGLVLAGSGYIAALIAGSLLIGFGYGLTNPASSHLLQKSAPAGRRNLIFSIKQTGVPLGGIAAGLIAPPIAVAAGWPTAFFAAAAFAIALMFALQTVRTAWDDDRDPDVRLTAAPFDGVRVVWAAPDLRCLSLAAFCFAATQLCLTTFLVALMVEDLGFTLIAAGALLSAVQASGFAGRIFWGWAADRTRDGFVILTVTSLIMMVGTVATALIGDESTRIVVGAILLLFGFAAIGWNGVYLAEVARGSAPGRIGSATGGSLVFTFAGVLCGPPVFALAYQAIGAYTATFGLLTVIPAAGLIFVYMAGRHRQKQGPLP